MARNHEPCRICGKVHRNPASSTLCVSCGANTRQKRLDAEQDKEQRRQEREANLFTTAEALNELLDLLSKSQVLDSDAIEEIREKHDPNLER